MCEHLSVLVGGAVLWALRTINPVPLPLAVSIHNVKSIEKVTIKPADLFNLLTATSGISRATGGEPES